MDQMYEPEVPLAKSGTEGSAHAERIAALDATRTRRVSAADPNRGNAPKNLAGEAVNPTVLTGTRTGRMSCVAPNPLYEGQTGRPASVDVGVEGGPVNHPAHYGAHPTGIECIDVIEHMTANIASAMKYLWRAGLKPDNSHDQDLAKAVWYIERERARITSLGDQPQES